MPTNKKKEGNVSSQAKSEMTVMVTVFMCSYTFVPYSECQDKTNTGAKIRPKK